MKEGAKASLHQILTDYLELNNYRKTPERYAILDAVYSINGHFTLDELNAKLADECHFPVSRLFMELRLVLRHRFQGATKYEACYNNGSHSHQVCTICGKVVEIKVPEINAAINDLRLKRFRKDGYSLYIYGVCSACQARMTRKKSNETRQKQQKDNKK